MQTIEWFKKRSFHYSSFKSIEELVECKEEKDQSLSLCIPTYNEEETIGEVLSCYQKYLVQEYPLLDEIMVLDGRSEDSTTEIVRSLGIPFYFDDEPLEEGMERVRGKGEALWKSLYYTEGDIILWSDGDIKNPDPRFVYGILGPLLKNEEISFVKAFYRRPLTQEKTLRKEGGGRVTELVVKPLLNLFYPDLGAVAQPLSGEYGGRREILESIPFSTGYGVETGLLLDIYREYGLEAIAQVDMEERVHENQDLSSLKKMSFCILQRFFAKLEEHQQIEKKIDLNRKLTNTAGDGVEIEVLLERERPPIIEIPAYQEKFAKDKTILSLDRES